MRMAHFFKVIGVITVVLGFISPALAADDYSKTVEIYKDSPTVQPFFKSSYGYAVFPLVGKGGFVVGGSFGKGLVFRGDKVTGETALIKASIGAQLGGQAFSEIIFFQDERAYKDFTSGDFEFDATASAVAIVAGAQAKAGTEGATASTSTSTADAQQFSAGYRKGMAVFMHIKGGLMYEASIGGQTFTFKPVE